MSRDGYNNNVNMNVNVSMETQIIKIGSPESYELAVNSATELLKNGDVVAVPTETVYGLAADAFNENGVKKIYKVKSRPLDNPLIFHIGSIEQLSMLTDLKSLPLFIGSLIENFWPGPLTLVLPKNEDLPDFATAGLNSIAVRLPDSSIVRDLCLVLGSAVVAPSANLSGRPSPTLARHVESDLAGKIPLLIDGGATAHGLESTVLDLTSDKPTLLRPGAVSVSQIEQCIGEDVLVPDYVLDPSQNIDQVKSPGMKYKHYSPHAEVVLVMHGDLEDLKQKVQSLNLNENDFIIGLVGYKFKASNNVFFESIEEMAANLFDTFRSNESNSDRFVVCLPSESDSPIYMGLLNRVSKAADKIVV